MIYIRNHVFRSEKHNNYSEFPVDHFVNDCFVLRSCRNLVKGKIFCSLTSQIKRKKWESDGVIYIYFNFTSLVHGNSEIISISVFSSLWWMPWWFQSHSWENSQPFWAQPSYLTVDTRDQIKKSRMKKINVPKYASSSSEVNMMIHLWTFSKTNLSYQQKCNKLSDSNFPGVLLWWKYIKLPLLFYSKGGQTTFNMQCDRILFFEGRR